MRGINDLEVTVSVPDLLEKMRQNRAEHGKVYREAVVEYHKEAVKQLADRLNEVSLMTTEDFEDMNSQDMHNLVRFDLQPPVSYLGEYDQVIGMLEVAKDDTIKLGAKQINAWYHDRWDWSDTFEINTLSYSAHGKKRVRIHGRG